MGRSVAKRCRESKELILAPWEGSVTRRVDMTISTKGEVALGRRKGGDDASWTDANLTGPTK
jgi:hypothetical protein